MADGVIDSLSIEIGASATKAEQQINNLVSALEKLKGASVGKVDISGINQAAEDASNAEKKVQNLTNKVKSLKGTGTPKTATQSGQSDSGGEASSRSLKDSFKGLASSLTPVIGALQTVEKVAKSVFNRIKSIVKGVINVFKKIGSAVKSVISNIAKVGKGLLQWGAKTLGLDRLANSLKHIQSLFHSIGRIALYRAIRSAIKYVTEALKEGSENAYHFAREFGDATRYIADAYDNLNSANFKMSNQLGAAWATLIAAIEPIIMRIISLVTRAADALTRLFALLGGRSTYLKAVDYNKQWADSAGGAAKAAKEWKNQLLGFDEINRLEAPADSGGGGGGGSPLDYENMFEESPIGELFEQIRDLWADKEFVRLGRLLGDKFNKMINSIKWSKIGKTIGEKISGVIETSYAFLKRADFTNLGKKISDLLDSLGDEINFNTFGRLFMRIRTAIWDVLYGATINLDWKAIATNLSDFILGALQELTEWLENLDTDKIATAIKDFFGNIKYDEIKETFKTLIKTAWEKATALESELFPDGLVPTVTQAIVNFFKNVDWQQIADTVKEGLGKIKELFVQILDILWPPEEREAFKERLTNLIADVLTQGFRNAWSSFKDEALNGGIGTGEEYEKGIDKWADSNGGTAGGNLIRQIVQAIRDRKNEAQESGLETGEALRNGLTEGIGEPYDDVKDAFQAVTDGVKSDYGIHSPSTVFREIGDNIGRGFEEGIRESIEVAAQTVRSSLQSVEQAFNSVANYAYQAASIISQNMWAIVSACMNAISALYSVASAQASIGGLSIQVSNPRGFASGGFPEDGLFMANHGELVGQFSNGKTAVANNEQIIEGIRQGVYEAVSAAMSTSGGNDDREIVIMLDGKTIATSTTRYQRQLARAMG